MTSKFLSGDETMRATFQGSIVAMVTPFRNGKIDEPKVKELVELHVKNGTDAIRPSTNEIWSWSTKGSMILCQGILPSEKAPCRFNIG